jgi:hypothetical protein
MRIYAATCYPSDCRFSHGRATVHANAPPRKFPQAPSMTAETRLVPIERWPETGQLWPSDDSEWRWLLRRRESDPQLAGLQAAVIKIGRRILIDEQAFIAWAKTYREASVKQKT